jgi:hypothetical protein
LVEMFEFNNQMPVLLNDESTRRAHLIAQNTLI